MWRTVLVVTGAILAVAGLLWLLLLAAIRYKMTILLTAVRRMNRAMGNPRAMRTAGRPGAYASVIQHVGRASGREYRTPIVAVPTGEGFAIALPYGDRADWVRNVRAANRAVLITEGRTHELGEPEIVPAAVANRHFPPGNQRTHRLYGVDDFLLLRHLPDPESGGSSLVPLIGKPGI